MSSGNILISIFWFFLLFAWIWLLIMIFADIFRDHTLGGWGKALWCLFIIVVPWLGALIYLIARGASMSQRAQAQAQRDDERFRRYVQDTAATDTASTADELAKLAELRDRGAITAEEYDRAKGSALAATPAHSVGPNNRPSATTPTT